MRFAMMLEAQQGMTYDDQLAIVRRAEAAGFESFFRSDHYAGFPRLSAPPPEEGRTAPWNPCPPSHRTSPTTRRSP